MSELTNNTINFIEFATHDQEKAKAFYGSVFGWTYKDYGPSYSDILGAGLSGGLNQDPDSRPKNGTLVVLYVIDLEATLEKIKAAGGKITKDIFSFPGGRRFHFSDLSGNELAVWSDGTGPGR
jgi:predicted enzyme related to lactoylglutathione lyase